MRSAGSASGRLGLRRRQRHRRRAVVGFRWRAVRGGACQRPGFCCEGVRALSMRPSPESPDACPRWRARDTNRGGGGCGVEAFSAFFGHDLSFRLEQRPRNCGCLDAGAGGRKESRPLKPFRVSWNKFRLNFSRPQQWNQWKPHFMWAKQSCYPHGFTSKYITQVSTTEDRAQQWDACQYPLGRFGEHTSQEDRRAAASSSPCRAWSDDRRYTSISDTRHFSQTSPGSSRPCKPVASSPRNLPLLCPITPASCWVGASCRRSSVP